MIGWNDKWGNVGELGTHKGFVYHPTTIASTDGLELGKIISFVYKTTHVSETTDTGTSPAPRLAFVMHPNWKGKCHALTLKYLDRSSLVEHILPSLKAGMSDPDEFYYTIYKPSVLYQSDAYRTYVVNKMYSVTQFDYAYPLEGNEGEEVDEFFNEHPNVNYRNIDRAYIYDLFKNGGTMSDVKKYYNNVVLKRPQP